MSKPDNYMAVLKHAVAIMNEEHLEDSTCIDESYSGRGLQQLNSFHQHYSLRKNNSQ